MKNNVLILIISGFIFITASYCYGERSTSILSKAMLADKYVSYVGMKSTVVNVKGNMISTKARVFHMKPNKTRTEYISPSSVAGIVIIRNESDVWQFDIKNKIWEHFTEEEKKYSTDFGNEIKENYYAKLENSFEIAKRDVHIINIAPRDKNRFSRKLWIDMKYFLVLGSDIKDVEGNLRSSSRFLEIDYSPDNLDNSLFVVDGKTIPHCKNTKIDFTVIKPAFLPDGFRLVKSKGILMKEEPCSHLKYSDGINNFSIFQIKSVSKTNSSAVLKMSCNMIIYNKNGWEFRLAGDLSLEILKRIALSIKI